MALSLLSKRDASPDAAAISLVEERLKAGKDARLEAERQWALNLAFYQGRQWVYYNKTTNRVQVPPAPPWRVRHTANYITPMVTTLLAKLSRKRPDWAAVPASGDEEDVNAAKKSTQLLDYLWPELSMTPKRYHLMLWMLCTNKAFLKVYWDRSAGPVIEESQTEAQEPSAHEIDIESETIRFHLGDVAVEVVSGYELAVDPSADRTGTLESAGWVVHESIRTVEDIEAEWGVKVSPENVSGEKIVQAAAANYGGGDNLQIGGGNRKLDHHSVLKEMWQRPTPSEPDGRLVVVASGKCLYDDVLPYRSHDGERDIAFIEFVHTIVPGKFWSGGPVGDLIGPQKAINVGLSKLMEIQNLMSMPKLLYQEGSIDPGKWTSEPGQMVAYRGLPPVPWTPQAFPQGVFELINVHLESMYKISGVREFALSGAPTGPHSGVALNLLIEQDETRLGPVLDLMEDSLARVGAMMLQLVQGDGTNESPYGYLEPRTIRVTGHNGAIETLDFMASDVRFADVRVQAGSSLPKSKAAQQQFIMDLVQAKILTDPERILKLLDLGSVEPAIDETEQDELAAEMENRRMAQGIPQSPHLWENHPAHIEEHNRFRKRDVFDRLPPDVQALFEVHVEAHKAMLVQVEQEHALMQLAPQLTVAQATQQAAEANAPQRASSAAAGPENEPQTMPIPPPPIPAGAPPIAGVPPPQ